MVDSGPFHPALLSDEALLSQSEIRLLRRSGPGGQHRNKVETAVVLKHRESSVAAEANERRSQAENRRVALMRLRVRLAVTVRSRRTAEQLPSSLWSSRVSEAGTIAINESHADFPAMLVDALDAWDLCGHDLNAAAELLRVSGSQLVKFFKKEPQAFRRVNDDRRAAGLHILK